MIGELSAAVPDSQTEERPHFVVLELPLRVDMAAWTDRPGEQVRGQT